MYNVECKMYNVGKNAKHFFIKFQIFRFAKNTLIINSTLSFCRLLLLKSFQVFTYNEVFNDCGVQE